MNASPGRLLRALAGLLIRGPGSPYVIGDLAEGLRRDAARGMSVHRARVRFLVNAIASGLSLARARLRVRGWPSLGPTWIDVKLGWRILRKNPLLSSVAALSLAVGIPVGMAPVHIVEAFDAPLPVEDGDRLMGLRYRGIGRTGVHATSYDLGLWRETLTSFEGLAAFRTIERNLAAGGGVGTAVSGAEVTSSAFGLLRTRPLLGRTLQAADERPGAPAVVVLGYDVWRARLAAAPGIVGATVRIGGIPHTVVGVMPEGFHFPIRQSLWLPLQDRPAGEPGQGAPLRVFGRLTGGATPDAAQTELAAVHGRMAAQFPEPYGRVAAEVVMLTTLLNDFPKGGMGAIEGVGGLSAVVMFQALALVLLTLACANVGLLIFARTATRSAELAMRTALGASRARIVGQIATEAFVLALLAAGVGLLIMDWLPNRLLAALWSPEQGGVPRWIDLGLTPATVVRALVLAGFSATVAAIFPALRVTGTAIRRNMQRAEGGGYGIRFGGVWNALVVADVAFALAAFGFVGGLGAKMAPVASGEAMVGFAAEEYLSVRLALPAAAAAAADPSQAAAARARVAETQRRLVERLEAEPGVRGVAMADRLPRMDHDGGPIEVEGEGSFSDDAARARVDPGFFEALGQPLLAGRGFHGGDLDGERSSVIVNSVFAERVLAGRNPIGRRVRFVSRADGEAGPWFEIVGMVGDLGMDLVQPQNASGVYHPVASGEISSPYLAVRVADPAAFEPRLREIAAEVEPAAIVRAIPLDDVYPIGWYVIMGMAAAWTMFVVVLLTLAASGIYAIMAFAVAQRTREIGIRSALGARGSDIASTIGRRAAVQLGTGAVIGLPLAAFMYSRTGADPSMKPDALIVAVVPGFLVLLTVALVACTVPLLRALRITPTEAMKVG